MIAAQATPSLSYIIRNGIRFIMHGATYFD